MCIHFLSNRETNGEWALPSSSSQLVLSLRTQMIHGYEKKPGLKLFASLCDQIVSNNILTKGQIIIHAKINISL